MKITCPHCGDDAPHYLENVTCQRGPIVQVDGDDRVYCDGLSETEGWDELATNPRLWCSVCHSEYPIPEGLDIEWT